MYRANERHGQTQKQAHTAQVQDEDDESSDLHSIPDSITPRPTGPQNMHRRTASSRIGSGATPCFQPRQEGRNVDTNPQGQMWKPNQDYEYHNIEHWQNTEDPASSVTSLTPSRLSHTTRDSAAAFLSPITPQFVPGDFVQSPIAYEGSPGVSPSYPRQRGTNESRYVGHPQTMSIREAPNKDRTSEQESSFSPPTQPSRYREQQTGPRRGPRHHQKPSHTRSNTWSRDQMSEEERWGEIDGNLRHMELIPRSPFVPHNFKQWVDHRADRHDDEVHEAQRIARIREETAGLNDIHPSFGGKRYSDGRTSVLGRQSIWQPHLEPQNMGYAISDWPSYDEMREEGDERNTSRFGRYLGLPRTPSDDNASWKVRPQVESTEFDSVWPLPTMQSIEESRKKWEAGETAQGEDLIGDNLMNGLECDMHH